MNGAQWVVHALRAQGVETVFGYPGGAIMPIYDALYDGGVEHLLCRHEQGAAMAAIGYARATGKTGVCMATSGPGATNLITGLADALLDSVPVVAITGQVALRSSVPMLSRKSTYSVYRWPAPNTVSSFSLWKSCRA
jgi:acetolactate synthase-1/2/3 large subunit